MLTAYIGMGANLPSHVGSPAATLNAAAARLDSLGRVLRRSSLYSTAPIGFAGQPRFINAVVALETELSPHSLLEALLVLEREFGRDRSTGIPNGPRTLDLDILMMGDLRLCESDLELPHPRLAERAFVLIPLHEIAPLIVEPRHRATVAELLQRRLAQSNAGTDSAVQMRDDRWDAGPGIDPAPPDRPARTGSGEPDRHS